MEVFEDNDIMNVFTEDNSLFLVWREGTEKFTDEQFKECALKFLDAVVKSKTKNIVVDMRNFRFNLSDDLIYWRNINLVSEYNRLGIEKFAFITDVKTVDQDNPENSFVTKTFLKHKEALKWMK